MINYKLHYNKRGLPTKRCRPRGLRKERERQKSDQVCQSTRVSPSSIFKLFYCPCTTNFRIVKSKIRKIPVTQLFTTNWSSHRIRKELAQGLKVLIRNTTPFCERFFPSTKNSSILMPFSNNRILFPVVSYQSEVDRVKLTVLANFES